MNQTNPRIAPSLVYWLLYGGPTGHRFTQDSPVLPEVWLELARDPDAQVATLSVPYGDRQAHELAHGLYTRLRQFRHRTSDRRAPSNVSDIPGIVGADLYLDEIVAVLLPMTRWWVSHDFKRLVDAWHDKSAKAHAGLWGDIQMFLDALVAQQQFDLGTGPAGDAPRFSREQWRVEIRDGRKRSARFVNASSLRLLALLAVFDLARRGVDRPGKPPREASPPIDSLADFAPSDIRDAMMRVLDIAAFSLSPHDGQHGTVNQPSPATIFTVSLNRPASGSNLDSVRTAKGDAAKRLFDISCAGLVWAIIDSGVNPRHFAFRTCSGDQRLALAARWDELGSAWCEPIADARDSRVIRRFDLSFVYQLRNRDVMLVASERLKLARTIERECAMHDLDMIKRMLKQMAQDLLHGRATDWAIVAELVAVGFDRQAQIDHGTHVAGILGGAWPEEDDRGQIEWVEGMCPDIRLADFKVTGSNAKATEYAVIAAMRLIRHLNEANDFLVIHGANLSLSIPHDVTNYACGRTPVCDEAEKLHKSGVVVVAAAGNEGYNEFQTQRGVKSLHTTTSITDPGNAEEIITVGSTHRREPHNYGVSYFSSRGPTGDGRMKPDLVAPGEKIFGPVGETEFATLEGTSMAAPHVSGGAAMLMSRYPELIGKPERIKQLLCSSATDVGRERAFQGHGVLDVLRALQSV